MASSASKPAAKKRAAREDEQTLPAAGELKSLAAGILSIAGSHRHERAFSFLRALVSEPPRSILIEGGNAGERAQAALFWAMALNCAKHGVSGVPDSPGSLALPGLSGLPELPGLPERSDSPGSSEFSGPCCSCPTCLQLLARMHRDLFFLDGIGGSIGIDDVRAVRSTLGENPREAKFRVVILSEAQHLTEAAANAMLKSLEEALPATRFVLTAPQRERLLPTLVSRSWAVTLAWPDPLLAPEDEARFETEQQMVGIAAEFLATGRGLFDKTGARGGMDIHGANALIISCQRALAQALSGCTAEGLAPGESAGADLARYFALLSDQRRGMATAVLAEGQESLTAQVNPALVVDWVMTRLYLLSPRGPRR